ncbi:hypothetical protein [Pseudodesulfovibrio sp. zrk46]|uniref:hypothetical protein n=1 Tax=Pseudodesulfovibrio sp. zrk46 TaxID=2725288 RepID=UPI001449EC3B|nr:hypothetical protein [Pseudodesulfovibrio sp. zrk46]QJB55853.1 hypothetical protein HFN16_05280 [Pseudodesulfovibrio sp. zrk46]
MITYRGTGRVVAVLLAMVLAVSLSIPTTAQARQKEPIRTIVDTRAYVYSSGVGLNKIVQPADDQKMLWGGMTGLVGSVGTLLAKGVIDKGFDMMSVALKKAAGKESLAEVSVSAGGMQLARVVQKEKKEKKTGILALPGSMTGKTAALHPTIVVAHGTFGGSVAKTNGSVEAEAKGLLNLTDEKFMLIAGIEYSDSMEAMRLVPKYVFYNGGLKGKRKINVVAHFTFRLPAKPDPKSESTAFGAATLVFNELKKKTELKKDALQGKQSGWMLLPEWSGDAGTDKHVPVPIVVEVQLVETKKPNKLLLLMADAFDSKKDEMKEAVNATINIGKE